MRRCIIPQQETSGNYNHQDQKASAPKIIPQQETSGNYNRRTRHNGWGKIIPQQETSGNYNMRPLPVSGRLIIPQQETSGNYNCMSSTFVPLQLYHNKKRQGDKIGLKKIISDILLKKCLFLFCHGPL